MSKVRWFTMIVAGLLPLTATSQDKVTIKPRHDAKGDVSNITREEKIEESVRVTGPDGKELQKKSQTTLVHQHFQEEILEKVAGQRPTKVTRKYDKAEIRIGDKTENLAYSGKTVAIEKVDDAFTFKVDGKALEGRELGTLPKDFDAKRPSEEDSEKLFLPNKAVTVGETWTVDAKAVLQSTGGKEAEKMYDVSKAKASGKLLKVFKKDGSQFGVIEFEVSVPMKEFAGRFPCKEGAMLNVKMTGEVCIDGTVSGGKSSTVTSMKGKADILKDDKPTGAVIEFEVSSTSNTTGTPVKK